MQLLRQAEEGRLQRPPGGISSARQQTRKSGRGRTGASGKSHHEIVAAL